MDWILYFVFGAASLLAVRNTILMGLVGAVLLGTLPAGVEAAEFRGSPSSPPPRLLLLAIASALKEGQAFQLRAAEWMLPTKARRFPEGAQRHRAHVQHL